jgi:hypothetical protein
MEEYMSGDKRFLITNGKTSFSEKLSEDEFNKNFNGKGIFLFNGINLVRSSGEMFFDPQLPTENQAEEFAKVKERMRSYSLMQQTSEASSD